jgi:hypothetical protein
MSSLQVFAQAIDRDDSSTVETLISRGLVDVNARLPREFEPPALVRAAELGRKAIVDILLRANARVDDTDKKGRTACHVAVDGAHADTLASLLAHRPNLAVVDRIGRTSLYLAMERCRDDNWRSSSMLLLAGAPLFAQTFDYRPILCWFASRRAWLPYERFLIVVSMYVNS